MTRQWNILKNMLSARSEETKRALRDSHMKSMQEKWERYDLKEFFGG